MGDPVHINTKCILPPGSLHASEHIGALARELLVCNSAGYETLHKTRTHALHVYKQLTVLALL